MIRLSSDDGIFRVVAKRAKVVAIVHKVNVIS